MVDKSEGPKLNNEGARGYQCIVGKSVATGREIGDRFGTEPDTELVPGGEKTITKIQKITCEKMGNVSVRDIVSGLAQLPCHNS